VVIEQSGHSLLTPTVKIFFSTRSMAHIPPELIDLVASGVPATRSSAAKMPRNGGSATSSGFGHPEPRERAIPLLPALAAQCIGIVAVGIAVLALSFPLVAASLLLATAAGPVLAAIMARWMRHHPGGW
jgi:hypothetical protein